MYLCETTTMRQCFPFDWWQSLKKKKLREMKMFVKRWFCRQQNMQQHVRMDVMMYKTRHQVRYVVWCSAIPFFQYVLLNYVMILLLFLTAHEEKKTMHDLSLTRDPSGEQKCPNYVLILIVSPKFEIQSHFKLRKPKKNRFPIPIE